MSVVGLDVPGGLNLRKQDDAALELKRGIHLKCAQWHTSVANSGARLNMTHVMGISRAASTRGLQTLETVTYWLMKDWSLLTIVA